MSERAVISLMPSMAMSVIQSPTHVSELVSVVVSSDVHNGEIYEQGGFYEGEKWVKQYTFTRKALDKLQVAGGIREVPDECWTREIRPRVWESRWSGIYTTPTGIEIHLIDEYTFDVAVGGTRWEERKSQEVANACKKLTNNWKLKAEGIERKFLSLTDEQRSEITLLAEAIATRYVRQAAQFGHQRARTGARLRAMRTYFNIGRYTLDTIANSVFGITRTRYDFAKVAETIGSESAKVLEFGRLALEAGLDIEQLARVRLMLEGGPQQLEPVEEDQIIEAEVSIIDKPVVEASDNPFAIEYIEETLVKAQEALAKILGGAAPRDALWKSIKKYLGAKDEYTEGDILVFSMFLEKVQTEVDAGTKSSEVEAAKAIFATSARRFIQDRIVPELDDVNWHQIELPKTE